MFNLSNQYGIAYVDFATEQEAHNALQAVNGTILNGEQIIVDFYEKAPSQMV